MEILLKTFHRNEVLQYLRWTGSEIPKEIDALIDDCIQQTLRVAQPRFTYRIFPINREEKLPILAFIGKDVPSLLAECSRVIYLAATLGNGLELAIRRAQVKDLSRALILDCCGSAAIEEVCQQAESQIQENLKESCYFTDRFSPGYGDFPLAVQPEFVNILDAGKQIGLTVTRHTILMPRKSVTALIGISDKPQTKRFRGCAYCSMFESCMYRKAGKTCGRE